MRRFVIAVFAFCALVANGSARAEDIAATTKEVLLKSEAAVIKVLPRGASEHTWFKKEFQNAKGILVVPSLLKGGFVVGGEYGHGVLLARQKDGSWGQPAFYTLGGGSVGLQIGVQESQVVFLIRTEKGLKAIMEDQLKLGAEAGVAVGTLGTGMEASTTSAIGADIFQLAYSQGAFGGGALEGSVFAKRSDWNKVFYGKALTPQQIVLEGMGQNPQADALRKALTDFDQSK